VEMVMSGSPPRSVFPSWSKAMRQFQRYRFMVALAYRCVAIASVGRATPERREEAPAS
jgi:hypothetical protein